VCCLLISFLWDSMGTSSNLLGLQYHVGIDLSILLYFFPGPTTSPRLVFCANFSLLPLQAYLKDSLPLFRDTPSHHGGKRFFFLFPVGPPAPFFFFFFFSGGRPRAAFLARTPAHFPHIHTPLRSDPQTFVISFLILFNLLFSPRPRAFFSCRFLCKKRGLIFVSGFVPHTSRVRISFRCGCYFFLSPFFVRTHRLGNVPLLITASPCRIRTQTKGPICPVFPSLIPIPPVVLCNVPSRVCLCPCPAD